MRAGEGSGCGGWFSARLPGDVAPEGFGGGCECCRLGCGGWGCCSYACRKRGRNVVFKVPRGYEVLVEGGLSPAIPEAVAKGFAREAGFVARLNHPHILRLLGYSRRAPLLVYEYADGGTLGGLLSRGWRPGLAEAALVGAQLADALRYIHSRGLVHGDVKPDNVFIVKGVLKLGGFSTLTATIAPQGPPGFTPGWRPPELVSEDLALRAKRLGYEDRADVYQLGNLLLYMLAGESIDGEERLKGDEGLRRALAKVGHGGLGSLIASMMEVDPARRPSAEEASSRLAGIYYEVSQA